MNIETLTPLEPRDGQMNHESNIYRSSTVSKSAWTFCNMRRTRSHSGRAGRVLREGVVAFLAAWITYFNTSELPHWQGMLPLLICLVGSDLLP
jgi:hypothetical protein